MAEDLETVRAQLARALRERDEYQSELHTLVERCRTMTSAASSAAGTAVVAIGRLQQMDVVVKAAQAWRAAMRRGDSVMRGAAYAAFATAIDQYTAIERSRS